MSVQAILEAAVAAHQGLMLIRAGNPYHDQDGKFTTGGGAHGKHHARNQRRRARKKAKLESLRKSGHAEIKELRETHKGQRQDMLASHRTDRRELKREHKSTRKEYIRDAKRERADQDRGHKQELKALAREKATEHKEAVKEHDPSDHEGLKALHEEHAKDLKESMAQHQEEHAGANEYLRKAHKEGYASLKSDQKQEQADLHATHKEERQDLLKGQKGERRELIEGLKQDIKDAGFRKRKSVEKALGTGALSSDSAIATSPSGIFLERSSNVGASPNRMGRGRTHKASSAEAILCHVLRQRGWTRQYARGELTGRQHLGLLEDIRQYGRSWLRHEAESLFDRYGVEDDRPNHDASLRGHNWSGSREREGTIPNGMGDTLHVDADSGITRGLAQRAAGAIRRFFQRARQFVHELIMSGSMSLFGPDLSADEVATLDNEVRIQSQYLDRFEQEVIANPPREIAEPEILTITASPPPMTPGQFTARVEQYANSTWQSSQRVNRGSVMSTNIGKLERRVLGHPRTEHCSDCPPLAAMGWQPIGTLPAIGDSECKQLCLCHFEYQDENGKTFATPRSKRLKLKRLPQPAIPATPGGPGPSEKPKPPKGRPPAPKPTEPTLQDLINEAGGPFYDAQGNLITYETLE
jgi:hypothetical protein